jgi:hypothetical protein
MPAGTPSSGGGCGYIQAMTDQRPVYDNSVRKRTRTMKKKKRKGYGK